MSSETTPKSSQGKPGKFLENDLFDCEGGVPVHTCSAVSNEVCPCLACASFECPACKFIASSRD